ncbi:tetratricopeptide repeat protein [Metallosphaera javensis (ex Sakai et al. 2022)]|uniref:tetratricopeptide repeat protein n=1 Tax=Metallosphaera javensis (ex Sakai et al. 2022) TaxID=2775498 RepID=UPI00258C9EFD|nr:MAG: hypothetical protein MjAS7_2351 [Metallosphaera javensis (ex Sakai et al. 2022)]
MGKRVRGFLAKVGWGVESELSKVGLKEREISYLTRTFRKDFLVLEPVLEHLRTMKKKGYIYVYRIPLEDPLVMELEDEVAKRNLKRIRNDKALRKKLSWLGASFVPPGILLLQPHEFDEQMEIFSRVHVMLDLPEWEEVRGGIVNTLIALTRGMLGNREVLGEISSILLPSLGLVATAASVAIVLLLHFAERDEMSWASMVELSKNWSKLNEELKRLIAAKVAYELGMGADEAYTSLNQILGQWERLEAELRKLQDMVTKLENDLKKLREEILSRGTGRIRNEMELRRELVNLREPERIVGLGNSKEDREVDDLVNRVISQASGKFVLLVGEPGSGKTTLLYLVGRKLLQGRDLYWIRDVSQFSPVDFVELTDSYAIVDLTREENVNLLDRILKYEGSPPPLSRIVVAVREGYLKDLLERLREDDRFDIMRVNYSREVVKEIARRSLEHEMERRMKEGKLSGFLDQELDTISQAITDRAEGLSLYAVEAAKLVTEKLVSNLDVNQVLRGLPRGISSLLAEILRLETGVEAGENGSPHLLLTYYAVSHYPGFPEEFLEEFQRMTRTRLPRFVDVKDKVASLHSWYREVTDEIASENFPEGQDITKLVDEVRRLNGMRDLLRQMDIKVPKIREEIEKTLKYDAFATFQDVVDFLVFQVMISVVRRKLRRTNSGYGFDLLSEKLKYEELRRESLDLYYRVVGFLVNSYLQDSSRLEKRPFYWLTALYMSGLLTGEVAEAVSGWLSDINKKIDYQDLSGNLTATSSLLVAYTRRVVNVLEVLGILNPERDTEDMSHFMKGFSHYLKGEFDQAISEYDMAISLNPNNPAYHNNKATALREKGDLDGALRELERVSGLHKIRPI